MFKGKKTIEIVNGAHNYTGVAAKVENLNLHDFKLDRPLNTQEPSQ